MILWVDAFEAVALFGIVVLLFLSVASEPNHRMQRSTSVVVGGQEGTDGSSEVPVEEDAASSATVRVTIEPTFSRCFTHFGLFVGLLSLVAFVADILRFVDWKLFGKVAMVMDGVLGIAFLPMWLLWLGCLLPKATRR